MTRSERHFGSRQVERMLRLEREHIETIVRVLVDDAKREARKRKQRGRARR